MFFCFLFRIFGYIQLQWEVNDKGTLGFHLVVTPTRPTADPGKSRGTQTLEC